MIAREFIDTFYERRLANDVEGSLEFYSDKTRIVIAGDAANNPISATLSGAELKGALQALVDTWRWHTLEVKTVLTEGNQAAVH